MNAGNMGMKELNYKMVGGNAIAAMERRMAERAQCYNANVRGVKPSNANAKACVERMKAAASGGRRTRRRGGSRKSRKSGRRTTRRSWF